MDDLDAFLSDHYYFVTDGLWWRVCWPPFQPSSKCHFNGFADQCNQAATDHEPGMKMTGPTSRADFLGLPKIDLRF